MKIIEIASLPNGAHNNQTINGASLKTFAVPDGWAGLDAMNTTCMNILQLGNNKLNNIISSV